MMRLTHRLFAALFGLWFTVLTVEPARLHSCPMHDGQAVASHDMSHGMSHAGHGGHAPGAPESNWACTCLGACASAAAPSAPVTPTFAVALRVVVDPGLLEVTRAVETVAHAIPFANGPPRA